MIIESYLFFPGTTAEAMARYREIFGGELAITRRGDVDPSATGAERDTVINATLTAAGFTLRAGDRADASHEVQTRVELSLIGSDDAALRDVFDALAVGGTVKAPLEKMFWGDVFGAVVDRFGIAWQVNISAPAA
jgi:PhnB protein